MDASRFDAWTRAVGTRSGRRALLRGIAGSAVAIGAGGLIATNTDATKDAKQKAAKKKKKNKCAKRCGADCSTCYERVSGGVLCGGIGSADCNAPCTSDSDCAGTSHPVCTTSYTDRARGKTSTWGCSAACTDTGVCGG
jgi:hypothetical protein